MTSSVPHIKGYVPLRLRFDERESFLFAKPHTSGAQKVSASSTLFVSNVPFVGGIQTRVLLQAIFGKFGQLERVVVVRSPRKTSLVTEEKHDESQVDAIQKWKDLVSKTNVLFPLSDNLDEGKFAHVTYKSPKEMRNAFKAMSKVQKSKETGVVFTSKDLQELIYRTKEMHPSLLHEEEKSNSHNNSRVLRLADRYRQQIMSRDLLLQHCNQVMERFEEQEAETKETARNAAIADQDGFVTVTYKNSAGSKRELEDTQEESKRGSHKRSRKKSKIGGSGELQDFYRFQRKETQKKGIQDLRKRFEEDLAAVKKIKEEKKYQPFQE